MRTSFDDEKQLVQLARAYDDAEPRICWNEAATSSTTPETSTVHSSGPANSHNITERTCGSVSDLVASHDPGDLLTAATRSDAVTRLRSPSRRRAVASLSTAARSNEATRIPQPATVTQAPEGLEPLSLDALEVAPRTSRASPLSPTSAERAVVEIFADVSRETVLGYDGRSIHLNVGEILPGGVSILLREIQIDERDKFVGTGAGLGNMIAQVVLQTKVYRAIGIESRQDVLRAGPDPMNRFQLLSAVVNLII
ncbi:hypothetical protein PC116_g16572 [Phytophthora cactorum]|nr:hypothetical protein PC116_g16572 [Phytophthora cactorum]